MGNIKCKVHGCQNTDYTEDNGRYRCLVKGYCAKHYMKYKKYGNPTYVYKKTKFTRCKIRGCKNLNIGDKGKYSFTHGYCSKHLYRFQKYGDPNITSTIVGEHRTKNPLYKIYYCMKARCYNENIRSYKDYGGRGIRVCRRWMGLNGFSNFEKDMGNRPSRRHSLDRIRVNGNYTPKNCRWATSHQQASNKRNNNKVVGVRPNKSKFYATLTVDGVVHSSPSMSFEDAVSYRKQLEQKYLNDIFIIKNYKEYIVVP